LLTVHRNGGDYIMWPVRLPESAQKDKEPTVICHTKLGFGGAQTDSNQRLM
jgi:hypothetical protein